MFNKVENNFFLGGAHIGTDSANMSWIITIGTGS